MRSWTLALLLCATPAWAAGTDDAMGHRVQELLHAHQQEIFDCVVQQKAKVQGEMLIRVQLGGDGRAAKAEVLKDQSNGGPLGSCVVGKLKAWNLSSLQAAAGDQVVFPLGFKPTPLRKGEKRILVPMWAQDIAGPQRFLIDEGTIGEAPLASIDRLDLKPGERVPAKSREAEDEELVLFVLAGNFSVDGQKVQPYDAVWIGARTPRPLIEPGDKKPLAFLEIRTHGQKAGMKILRSESASSYPLVGGKAAVRLLLEGSGASLAVNDLQAEPGTQLVMPKHPNADEDLYFLGGRTETTIGKHTFVTAPGDALRVPANVSCTVKVIPGERLRAVQVFAPGGAEAQLKGKAPAKQPSKRKHG